MAQYRPLIYTAVLLCLHFEGSTAAVPALKPAPVTTRTSCSVGTTVATLKATGGTDPLNYTIDISTAPATKAAFGVWANGTVVVKKELGPIPASYNVSIKVVDSVAPTTPGTGTLSVTVTDNKGTPQFAKTSYCVVVPSNATTGTPIRTVRATDTPKTDTITYSIDDGDEPQKKFQIDPSTGNITKTAVKFAKATKSSYTLTVSAKDGATCPLVGKTTVIVNLDGSCSSAVSRISGTLVAVGAFLMWFLRQCL